MNEMRRQLETWVRQVIDVRDRIIWEHQVDELMWKIGIVPFPGGTLFEILGYTEELVGYQQQTGHKKPDFVLGKKGEPVMVLDNKKSSQRNLAGFKDQIYYYLHRSKAPVGLLFNGYTVAAVLNTNLAELHTFRDELDTEWIAEVMLDDVNATVDLLSCFSASNLGSNALEVATRLAQKRVDQMQKGAIAERFQEIMENPSDELIKAIIRTDPTLSQMNASTDDLKDAWVNKTVLSPIADDGGEMPKLNGGVNPTIRLKLTQLCGTVGWGKTKELLATNRITGLRYREDGKQVKGYRRVEPMPGVPDGLCVAGVSGTVGIGVIEQLDKLLVEATKPE